MKLELKNLWGDGIFVSSLVYKNKIKYKGVASKLRIFGATNLMALTAVEIGRQEFTSC